MLTVHSSWLSFPRNYPSPKDSSLPRACPFPWYKFASTASPKQLPFTQPLLFQQPVIILTIIKKLYQGWPPSILAYREESFSVMLVPLSPEYSWLLWWIECLLRLLAGQNWLVAFLTICSLAHFSETFLSSTTAILGFLVCATDRVCHITTSDNRIHPMEKEGR